MSDPTYRTLHFKEKSETDIALGKEYLLVIGIDEYKKVGKLENAVGDAKELKDMFISNYNFSQENCIEIYNEAATLEKLGDTFLHLKDTLKENDKLLVIYSGHGHFEPGLKEGYWVPVEARYGKVTDYLSWTFVTQNLAALKAKHVALIVDSCYSGAIMTYRDMDSDKNGGNGKPTEQLDRSLRRVDRDPSRWILASGRNEVVPDGIKGEHSPFAKELLYYLGLKEYQESGIRFGDLCNQVLKSVTFNSEQTPIGSHIYATGHRGGEYVFWPKGFAGFTSTPIAAEPEKTGISQKEKKRDNSWKRMLMAILATLIVSIVGFSIYSKINSKKEKARQNSLIVQKDTTVTDSSGLVEKVEKSEENQKEVLKENKPTYSYPVFPDLSSFQKIRGVPDRGLMAVKKDNKWGYIQKSGNAYKTVIPFKFDEAFPFKGELALAKSGIRYGWINPKGSFAIRASYLDVGGISKQKPDDIHQNSRVRKGKYWGIINASGKAMLDFEYKSIADFTVGRVALVQHRNGLWGFVSRKGQALGKGVVYESIGKFDGNYATAKLDGKTVMLDKRTLR